MAMNAMKKLCMLLLVVSLFAMFTGCYHRTLIRVRTETAPPTVAPTPIRAWATMSGINKSDTLTSPIQPVNYETPTIGKIYNNTPYPLTQHLPPEVRICNTCLKNQSIRWTYDRVRELKDSDWVHYDLLPMRAGEGDIWFQAPVGKTVFAADSTEGYYEYRTYVRIISDLFLADHLCRGDLMDWFVEVGEHYCK